MEYCDACSTAKTVVSEQEYNKWFYKMVINIFKHDELFEGKMKDRFHRETGKYAPNIIGF